MLFQDIKKVLVLAPHTDDGEFGCGGSIVKLIENGADVHYIAFSTCEKSVLPKFPSDILITEVKKATGLLGIKKENLHLLKYEVRTFNFKRQEILDDLIRFRDLIKPDLVFMPSLNDIHQDHSTIAFEAVRAFKLTNLLSYEIPWNNFSFKNTNFVILNEKQIETKINALKQYKSQEHRPYANEMFIKSQALTRGVQVGKKYAEVFEVVRLIQ